MGHNCPNKKTDTTGWAAFLEKVDKTDTCWNWTGYLNLGYGVFKSKRAHRVAYEHLVGPIPEGLVIDHLCRNRACVNPEHMEPVTNKENVLRGIGPSAQAARLTHCVNGHELKPENLNILTSKKTRLKRRCGACSRFNALKSYYKKPGNKEKLKKLLDESSSL